MARPKKKSSLAIAGALVAAMSAALPTTASADVIDDLIKQPYDQSICNTNKSICLTNFRDAPSRVQDLAGTQSGNGRLAFLVHTESKNTLRAIFVAAQELAADGHTVRIIALADNDTNPNDSRIRTYTNGLPQFGVTVDNPTSQAEFGDLVKNMKADGAEALAKQARVPQNGEALTAEADILFEQLDALTD